MKFIQVPGGSSLSGEEQKAIQALQDFHREYQQYLYNRELFFKLKSSNPKASIDSKEKITSQETVNPSPSEQNFNDKPTTTFSPSSAS